MPYLETPIINSSSPGTKGNFPSCFGGKQTKAFSADRIILTMKIQSRKYFWLNNITIPARILLWEAWYSCICPISLFYETQHESRKAFIISGRWGKLGLSHCSDFGWLTFHTSSTLYLAVKIILAYVQILEASRCCKITRFCALKVQFTYLPSATSQSS